MARRWHRFETRSQGACVFLGSIVETKKKKPAFLHQKHHGKAVKIIYTYTDAGWGSWHTLVSEMGFSE
jgi:hypothetical protein